MKQKVVSVVEKTKVLIVDNGVLNRKALTDAVNISGLAAVEHAASTGEHALDRLRQKPYDLVLLNILLDETPELKTLRVIRQQFPTVVVWMTGTKADFALRGVPVMALGVAGFLYRQADLTAEAELKSLVRQFVVLHERYAAKRRWEVAASGNSFAATGAG
ncbi:MAG TPA: response regulator, partial [Patescibacteria group bacterium]|nr:response regulator [Patescibacteria group bacterium]